jgi:Fe2+ or Zn2+ uptake regulation protein
MCISDICKELSNEMQLEILKILKTKKNINQIQNELKKRFNKKIYRETVYKKLENLVKLSIINKEYDQKSKRLVYYLVSKKIIINVEDLNVKKIGNRKS